MLQCACITFTLTFIQQYFERKRLMKRNDHYAHTCNNGLQTPLDRKSAVSQDMKSFCLLEQMHSKEMLCKTEKQIILM